MFWFHLFTGLKKKQCCTGRVYVLEYCDQHRSKTNKRQGRGRRRRRNRERKKRRVKKRRKKKGRKEGRKGGREGKKKKENAPKKSQHTSIYDNVTFTHFCKILLYIGVVIKFN